MPAYLFTARTPEGKAVTDRITAASVDGARYVLEIRRYADIVFHTDDASVRVEAAVRDELDPGGGRMPLAPEQELEARRSGGFLSGLWFTWKMNSVLWMPLAAWCLISYFGSRPFGWGDYLGFALAGLFLIYFIVLVIPGTAYQALLRASVWNRLNETRFWTGVLRRMPLATGGMFPRLDLDARLACVLARNERAEEGRALLAPYMDDSNPMTLGRIAGFYDTAGEHEKAHELRRRAVELSNGGIVETIDQALGLVRYMRRPAEARECLARIAGREIIEVARIYVAYIEGLIALEERRYGEALADFEKTDGMMEPMSHNELMNGMRREVWAFKSLALAGAGRMDEARALFRRARPLLEARRETELLRRCELLAM